MSRVCSWQVQLTQNEDEQSVAVDLMTKQETILIQKKLRVEAEIAMQQAETVNIEKAIHHLQIDLAKLDSLLYKERGTGTFLQQENQLLEAQFMGSLKVYSIVDVFYSLIQTQTGLN